MSGFNQININIINNLINEIDNLRVFEQDEYIIHNSSTLHKICNSEYYKQCVQLIYLITVNIEETYKLRKRLYNVDIPDFCNYIVCDIPKIINNWGGKINQVERLDIIDRLKIIYQIEVKDESTM